MAKFTPKALNSGFNDTDSLNENFSTLSALSDTWISRTGTLPNQMEADFDMNNRDILNTRAMNVGSLSVAGINVLPDSLVAAEVPDTTGQAGKYLSNNGAALFWDALSTTFFNNVAEMVNALTLQVGEYISLRGYHQPGDGGGGLFRVVAASTGTADGGIFIDLNTLQAQRVIEEDHYSVRMWGARGDGVTDDYASIFAAYNYTGGNRRNLFFPAGTYNHSSILNFNYNSQVVNFEPGVVIQYTGPAVNAGVNFDVGTSGFLWNGRFGVGNPPVIRAGNASNAVYCRSWHHGQMSVIVDQAAFNALKIDFAVLSRFDIECSRNRSPFVLLQPQTGLNLNQRDPDEPVTACEFYCIIEGTASEGVVCNQAQYCKFSGTSEGNDGGGYSESSTCIRNRLVQFFCEQNGNTDYTLQGSRTLLENSSGSSSSSLRITGPRNIIKGLYKNLEITNVARDTLLRDCAFISTRDGGSFVDNGFDTVYENVRMESINGSITIPDRATPLKRKRIGPILISGITNATDCFISASDHRLDNGDSITITDVVGMTELNGNTYQVEIRDNNTFWILSGGVNVDSTSFGVYTNGGTVTYVGLLNSWTDTSGLVNLGFLKTSENIVHLQGTVDGGLLGFPVFNLPPGYRPAQTIRFPVISSDTPSTSYISINSSGSLVVTTGATDNIVLDGITFIV